MMRLSLGHVQAMLGSELAFKHSGFVKIVCGLNRVSSMAHIQKADPEARRKAIKSILIGLAVGTVLFLIFDSLIGNVNVWIEDNAELLVEHHYLAFLLMLIPVAPVIGLSIVLLRYAGRIIKTQRFPPPDTPVIRDVRVVEGQAAVWRGRIAQLLCWIILLAAAAIPILTWTIFYTVSCIG
jgi:heme A synthase